MWDYYKRTFLAVQLAAGTGSWLVYKSTSHQWVPTAVFFLSMQVSSVFGAMWASQRKNEIELRTTCTLN